LAIYHTVVILY